MEVVSADEIDHVSDGTLGAKLTLPLPTYRIFMAPFALIVIPQRAPPRPSAEIDYGLALTVPVGLWFALHVNVAGVQLERGLSGARARAGLSWTLGEADSLLLARFYAYVDAVEYVGPGTTDLDAKFGVQLLLWDMFSFEVGGWVRALDTGRRTSATSIELLGGPGRPSSFLHLDEHTVSVQVALGMVF